VIKIHRTYEFLTEPKSADFVEALDKAKLLVRGWSGARCKVNIWVDELNEEMTGAQKTRVDQLAADYQGKPIDDWEASG
jgi:hypothetical protein